MGVKVIHAHSPQAKGRVERLFNTFQDRLVKELRLAGIATLEAANRFLEAYLPRYNRRFAVQPAQAADLHRPIPAGPRARPHAVPEDHPASCAAIGPWRITGSSIRSRPMSGRPTCWWKNGWMGRYASHIRAGGSTMRLSPRVRCVRLIPHRSTSRSARSSRQRIIRGANGSCLNENDTRRRPEHKPDISTLE